MIPIDRECKITLLKVLRRGGWEVEDFAHIPSQDERFKNVSKEDLERELNELQRKMGVVSISEDKARELTKMGLLAFDGKQYDLTDQR